MAERFLVVIPADPKAVLPETADALQEALTRMAGTDEARVKDYGKLQFIDAGENAYSVTCPACGHGFSAAAWRAWMDSDWHGEDGFHLHARAVECCGATLTLNQLIYDAPQGFARWFVSARQGERGPISDTERASLETVAGVKLIAIAQRY